MLRSAFHWDFLIRASFNIQTVVIVDQPCPWESSYKKDKVGETHRFTPTFFPNQQPENLNYRLPSSILCAIQSQHFINFFCSIPIVERRRISQSAGIDASNWPGETTASCNIEFV